MACPEAAWERATMAQGLMFKALSGSYIGSERPKFSAGQCAPPRWHRPGEGTDSVEPSTPFRRRHVQRHRSAVQWSPFAVRPSALRGRKMTGMDLWNWRRRPDLNRGWRFCRPYRVVFRSAWLRLLVPDDAWFSVMFGRSCSEVAPKFFSRSAQNPYRLAAGGKPDRTELVN